MEKTNKVIAGILVLVVLTVAVVSLTGSGEVNCEDQYDNLVDGNITSEEVNTDCKPIPEDVENQVLVKALSGNE